MLKTLNISESVEKEVVRFGNGSIVYTPKKWIGEKVLVVLEQKPLDISGETMGILKPHLSHIEGVFLYGSFARNEQAAGSDIDVLVISNKKISLHRKGRFDFLVKTREEAIKGIESDPHLFLYQIVNEAEALLNESLLGELKQVKPKPDLEEFLEETLSAFKSTKQLLDADRKRGKKCLTSNPCIYSLVLRLRGLFTLQCFIKGHAFSNRKFRKLLKSHGFKEKALNGFLLTYRAERDGKKTALKIPLTDAEKLFDAAKMEFLKTEEMVKKRSTARRG